MATSYESLLPEIIPMVPGCPDTLIESNIRAAAIELCEKAPVYQAELDPITTVANIFEYDLEPPSGAVVHSILWLIHEGKDLEPLSTGLVEQRVPDWRNASNAGTPRYFVKTSQSTINLVPTPSATSASSTILRAQLKPSHTSQSSDDGFMSDYRETVINGSLYRLLRTPSKEWTDYNGASVYAGLFNEGVVRAERRARHGDSPVARKVKYGGLYSHPNTKRNKYGQGG